MKPKNKKTNEFDREVRKMEAIVQGLTVRETLELMDKLDKKSMKILATIRAIVNKKSQLLNSAAKAQLTKADMSIWNAGANLLLTRIEEDRISGYETAGFFDRIPV